MLTKRIYLGDFIGEFIRSPKYRFRFTIPALSAMYDWLEEIGEPEFDVDQFANEWEQFENIDEASREYGMLIEDVESLRNHTHVLELPDDGILVMKFL